MKEDALKDLEDLVKKLPWTNPLKVWELNNSLKKRKTKRRKHHLQGAASKEKLHGDREEEEGSDHRDTGNQEDSAQSAASAEPASSQDAGETQEEASRNGEEEENEQSDTKEESQVGSGSETAAGEGKGSEGEAKVLKFRVTCNRAGDKHSFTSNEAARDFGSAVQEHFQWKADMTHFDVEVQCRAL